MTDKLRFGQFISEKRTRLSMTKRELAGEIGITTAYLSQIESGIRSNPKRDIIENLIICLRLNEEETYRLYDLYAKVTDTVAIDIAQFIKQNDIVSKAIRKAKKSGASETVWLEFIDRLNK